jgi:SAM-dependent methyltransferase
MSKNIESDASVFDSMAPGWYNFRHRTIFQLELEELAERWQQGRLLNLGCGHGADFLPFKDRFELTGVDFSAVMLEMARKFARKHFLKVHLHLADLRKLPFPDAAFDAAIAVASYHHLSGREEQLAALVELKRVLKPGAEAFITVWNRTQPRFWLLGREAMVPWRSGDETVYRYYHLFTYGEIEALVRQAGFTLISSRPESRYQFPMKVFSRNICLLIKKVG